MPLTPDSTSIGEGDCESGLGDTSNFERPIGRKVEKANWKNKAIGKDVEEYLTKKMKFIEESQEQEKESLRIKVEKLQLGELKDKERTQLEEEKYFIERGKLRIKKERGEEKLRIEKEIVKIEREKLEMHHMLEEERIMMKDTSAFTKAKNFFMNNSKRKSCKTKFT